MKYILKYALVLALVFALAGCGNSESKSAASGEEIGVGNESNPEKTGGNVKAVTENYDADFELCKNTEYVNLDWSNASHLMPDGIGGIYDLSVEKGSELYSNNIEFLDYFDKVSTHLFSEYESFNDKNNFRFISQPEFVLSGLYENDNYERIKTGDIKLDFLGFGSGWDSSTDNDGTDLECTSDGNYIKINRGNLLSKVERTVSNPGWFPTDSFPYGETFSVSKTVNIKLEDKETAIDEAAAYCEKYLNEAPFNTGDVFMTASGRILRIDDNTEGILFYLTTTYNGIPFDSINFEGRASDFSDGNEYLFTSSQALMVRSDEVEFCFLNNINRVITPIENEAQNIVSLKSAADIVSKSLSSSIKFEVLDTSLVYCVKQGLNGEPNTAAVHWKFELFNPNDNWTYVAYVNVRDESFFYFKHI